MGRLIFILGGCRSGKSHYAVKLAKKTAKKVLFVATAAPLDNEMRRRIKLHQKNRPLTWKTIEEPRDLVLRLKQLPKKYNLIIIDCLTLFISNLLIDGHSDNHIEDKVTLLLRLLKKFDSDSILVSNEVGLGIVPDNPLARRFRDLAGRINQKVADVSDKVYFMISGIPMKIKGDDDGKDKKDPKGN